jgi:hypothetical protein
MKWITPMTEPTGFYIQLSPDALEFLKRPVVGVSGSHDFLRCLQAKLGGFGVMMTPEDLVALIRLASPEAHGDIADRLCVLLPAAGPTIARLLAIADKLKAAIKESGL